MVCGETRPRIVISNTAHDGDDDEQEDQGLVLFFRGNAAERRSHGARVTSFDSGGIAARAFIEPRNRREISNPNKHADGIWLRAKVNTILNLRTLECLFGFHFDGHQSTLAASRDRREKFRINWALLTVRHLDLLTHKKEEKMDERLDESFPAIQHAIPRIALYYIPAILEIIFPWPAKKKHIQLGEKVNFFSRIKGNKNFRERIGKRRPFERTPIALNGRSPTALKVNDACKRTVVRRPCFPAQPF